MVASYIRSCDCKRISLFIVNFMIALSREVASSLQNADSQSDVFILVNNFDTMALRFPQMLSVLCCLAEVPYIHILASCDTVNAFLGMLWFLI